MACSSLLSDDDLRRFRTKPCRRNRQKGGFCEFGPDRCQYSHSEAWPRRCPFYFSNSSCIRYIPQVCSDVILGEANDPVYKTIGTVISNKCTRGGSCPFAHSLEEVTYHPLHYKTQPCPHFLRGQCVTYYCPFVHGTAERRNASAIKYNLPFSRGLFEISPFPNVEITSKIPTSQSILKCQKSERRQTDWGTQFQEAPSHHSIKYASTATDQLTSATSHTFQSTEFSNLSSLSQSLPTMLLHSQSIPCAWNAKLQSHDKHNMPLLLDKQADTFSIASLTPTAHAEDWCVLSDKSKVSSRSGIPYFPTESLESQSITSSHRAPTGDLNYSIQALFAAVTPNEQLQRQQTRFLEKQQPSIQSILQSFMSPATANNTESQASDFEVSSFAQEHTGTDEANIKPEYHRVLNGTLNSRAKSPASNSSPSAVRLSELSASDLDEHSTRDSLSTSMKTSLRCTKLANHQQEPNRMRTKLQQIPQVTTKKNITLGEDAAVEKKEKIASSAPTQDESPERASLLTPAKGDFLKKHIHPSSVKWADVESEIKQQLGQLLQSIERLNGHRERKNILKARISEDELGSFQNLQNHAETINSSLEMDERSRKAQWNEIREQMNRLHNIVNVINL